MGTFAVGTDFNPHYYSCAGKLKLDHPTGRVLIFRTLPNDIVE